MDHTRHLLGMATLNEKGQIVIPAEARACVDLHPGDKLLVICGPHQSGLMLIKPGSLEIAAKKLNEKLTGMQNILKQEKEMKND